MSLSPVVDLKEWCELYKIDAEPVECCGKKLEWTSTLAFKNYRGIQAKCECGNEPFTVVPVGENEISIWNSIRGK